MRSLRSARKVTGRDKSPQNENLNSRMCSKRPKSVKQVKQTRQALTDRTNSGSDLNTSISSPGCNKVNVSRPKRVQNIPARFLDHELSPIVTRKQKKPDHDHSSTPIPDKITQVSKVIVKPKTTKKSIVSISDHSSTPIPDKTTQVSKVIVKPKTTKNTAKNVEVETCDKPVPKASKSVNTRSKSTKLPVQPVLTPKKVILENVVKEDDKLALSQKQLSEDSRKDQIVSKNVTPVYKKTLFTRKTVTPNDSNTQQTHEKESALKNVTPLYKKQFKLLEKPTIHTPDRLALYDFNFDPSEEPLKAKKKNVKKKTAKKKRKVPMSETSSDDAALQKLIQQLKKIRETQKCKKLLEKKKGKATLNKQEIPLVVVHQPDSAVDSVFNTKSTVKNDQESVNTNLAMISPIAKERRRSFSRSPSPAVDFSQEVVQESNVDKFANSASDSRRISYFSELPAASSSMIQSVHKPAASPWRYDVDLGTRRWQSKTCGRPLMTPNERDDYVTKKRHVYTNISMLDPPSGTSSLQRTPNWKQTSILSFYEEAFKKSSKKRSHSPILPKTYDFGDTPANDESEEIFNENHSSKDTLNNDEENVCLGSDKKEKNATDDKYFGFDDSAELDQENVSPVKKMKLQNINTMRGGVKAVKKRTGILKEINMLPNQHLPTRMATTELFDVLNKRKETVTDVESPVSVVAEMVDPKVSKLNESDQSDESINITSSMEKSQEDKGNASLIGLFEEPIEPELVHFSKPTRKSYEKKKRTGQVTFQQVHREVEDKDGCKESGESDSDCSVASKEKAKRYVKRKKRQNVKIKKQEKEVEEWAAGFNSMLEEADDFPLCVE